MRFGYTRHPKPYTLKGAVSSGVERFVDTEEVISSNLIPPTKMLFHSAAFSVWPTLFLVKKAQQVADPGAQIHQTGSMRLSRQSISRGTSVNCPSARLNLMVI
jgi:hypothetical protein